MLNAEKTVEKKPASANPRARMQHANRNTTTAMTSTGTTAVNIGYGLLAIQQKRPKQGAWAKWQ